LNVCNCSVKINLKKCLIVFNFEMKLGKSLDSQIKSNIR
jgi:hypothetical protein